MASDARVLSARGLGADRGGRTVLDAVDLELHRGEVVAVIGPNGAGKSTLVGLLAGLEAPDRGRIERHGRVATVLQAPALARRSALANVEAGLAWWGIARRERRPRALSALATVGAAAYADRHVRALSGGEARRVHLARTLAVDPDALLLDEPFAGLDVGTRADLLYDASSALRSEARATLVVVHDRAEAWALADRVLVLLDGRLAASGSPREVFERPPSPEVAAFVGFAGRLQEPDGTVWMLRPGDVHLAGDGPLEGRVDRRVPLEEGLRLEVAVERGRVVTVVEAPGPEIDETVRLRAEGGVRFVGTDSEPDRELASRWATAEDLQEEASR